MKRILIPLLLVSVSAGLYAQNSVLTFTGRDASDQYIPLDRIEISNLTEGWHETLLWPDTVLTLQVTLGDENYPENQRFILSQNNPNPFNGTTSVNLTVTEPGDVTISVTDISGHLVRTIDIAPELGTHPLRITLSSAGVYFLSAHQKGRTASVKLINQSNGGKDAIEYYGTNTKKNDDSPKGTTTNPFHFGDQMEYIGYATYDGLEVESLHITQEQGYSQLIKLRFGFTQGTNDSLPCKSYSTVTDNDGNIYNTVQIGFQCWMKENLRTTTYPDGTVIPMGNSNSTTTAYRYCPNNDTSNVSTYGYLYNWPAVMNGEISSNTNPSGVQGICPKDWHLPSHAEWMQLINYVGNQSDYQCNGSSYFIIKAFAAQTTWPPYYDVCSAGYNPSTNNATGFTALTAGQYSTTGGISTYYLGFGYSTGFWSATLTGCMDDVYSCTMLHSNATVFGSISEEQHVGLSVRCLHD